MATIVRADAVHTPRDPFLEEGALTRFEDRGLAFSGGRVVACGGFSSVFAEFPEADGLAAYQGQMLREDGRRLTPVALLYLATSAGAQALGLGDVVGDLGVGKRADFVVARPPDGSALQAVLDRADGPEAALGALFTLAREVAITEVRVEGELVWGR